MSHTGVPISKSSSVKNGPTTNTWSGMWSATRRRRKIVRIDFTTEPPEYFEFLAARAPHILLGLYRRHISPAVTAGDLYDTGGYVELNRWNTRDGAMHLTHPSNSLGAELRLAADATILRRRGNRLLTDAQELIECAGYGEPARALDPESGRCNALAREGYAVTVENPVGLSMKGITTQGWTKPDGAPIGKYLRILRGPPGQIGAGGLRGSVAR